jgi:hypothetical protein
MLSVRPQVNRLSFHFFGRHLHPELFEVHAARRVDRQNYQIQLQITNVGHLISGTFGGLVVAELVAAAQQPIPTQRLLMSHEIGDSRTAELVYRDRVRYRCEFQSEPVDNRCFLAFQQQLAMQTECEGLVYQFGASGRMNFGALSYINVESRERSLRIRAFHTFPERCCLIKTASTYSLV